MIDVAELRALSSVSLHKLIEEEREENVFSKAEKEWREYAQGIHRPMATPEQKLMLGEVDSRDIIENIIGQCLDQIASRLRFHAFTVDDDTVLAFLNDTFAAKNQLDRAVMALTKRTQTDGNAAMSVSWRGDRAGRPVIHHESWWDGDKGMFVAVSDGGDVLWALSEWYNRDDTKWRTLYLDNEIIRYQKEEDGWTEVQVIPWVKRNGRPIGVPVAHFPNGASAYGPYAPSTVAAVIGAQDQLNASLFSRAAVVAMTGSQIYTATGTTADSVQVGPGKLWSSGNEGARFGVLPPGNLEPIINETDDLRAVICGAFSVPSYRIGDGDWPSGLALQRSDGPMIAAVRLLGDMEAPGLVYLAHRATELQNTFGTGLELNEDAVIEVEYEPADEVDPGTQVEIDTAKANLYDMLTELPEVLVKKLNVLTEQELADLVKELDERKAEMQEQFEVGNASPAGPGAPRPVAGW